MTRDNFQLEGTEPVVIERLKIWQRGEVIEGAVALSIQEVMPS